MALSAASREGCAHGLPQLSERIEAQAADKHRLLVWPALERTPAATDIWAKATSKQRQISKFALEGVAVIATLCTACLRPSRGVWGMRHFADCTSLTP